MDAIRSQVNWTSQTKKMFLPSDTMLAALGGVCLGMKLVSVEDYNIYLYIGIYRYILYTLLYMHSTYILRLRTQ